MGVYEVNNNYTSSFYGFTWDKTAYISVAFPANIDTGLNGINNTGTAVGYTSGHGFIYENGAVTSVFDSPIGGYLNFEDINNNGEILASNSSDHSWILKDGYFTELDGSEDFLLVYAYGMNDLGNVVGGVVGKDISSSSGMFLYDGKFNILDLPGFTMDINNRGQIVGNGMGIGPFAEHSYIATPVNGVAVPEPSLFLLFGSAIAAIGAGRVFILSQRTPAAC